MAVHLFRHQQSMTGTRFANDILSEGTSWGLFDQVVPMYNSLVISIDIAPNHKANSELLSSLASDQSSFSSFASQSGSGSEVIRSEVFIFTFFFFFA